MSSQTKEESDKKPITPVELLNDQAKKAFEKNDVEASRRAHEEKVKAMQHQHAHEEKHARIGEYVKSIVFGGLDGIITTFAIVAASVGSKMTYLELLIVGFANLIGDAFAMGLGDYFSSRAELEQARKLQKKYLWECETNPEKQKQIMINLFKEKGFNVDDSTRIVDCLAENKHAFVDIMLLELEGICPEEDSSSPIKGGIVMFFSFVVFGAIPMIDFFFAPDKNAHTGPNVFFFISMGLTAISLFILGAMKNWILSRPWWKGGIYMLFVGVLANGVAYGVGFLFELLLKLH